jgi:hypothetical protein
MHNGVRFGGCRRERYLVRSRCTILVMLVVLVVDRFLAFFRNLQGVRCRGVYRIRGCLGEVVVVVWSLCQAVVL